MIPEHFPAQPENIWKYFYQITRVPRPSKHEEKVIQYLIEFAKEHGFTYKQDNVQNVIMYIPGKGKNKDAPPVIIQNHIDMVTDALPDRKIDFKNDPIETKCEGDWLKAVGTTLGADNGLGCAAALAVAVDASLDHPPLELLFTTDEETGLNGALGLDTSHLSAKRMLNLDTEEWGSLYIGCAGGIDYELNKEIELSQVNTEYSPFKLEIKGFVGGHSGVEIHEQRGNAIKLLADSLALLNSKYEISIAEIRAGKAHNIIPRDAFANIWMRDDLLDMAISSLNDLKTSWSSFLPKNDQAFEIQLIPGTHLNESVLSQKDTQEMINYLELFPHGVHNYLLPARELVSTSNNLAKFLCVRGKVYTQTSLRFFDREEIKKIERVIYSLGETFGMKVEHHSEYPSWKPVEDNKMLELVKSAYEDRFQSAPNITAIHAGLECGILRDKIGPIDVVSFGPTITGAHSPDEQVHIPSVQNFWTLLTDVLARL